MEGGSLLVDVKAKMDEEEKYNIYSQIQFILPDSLNPIHRTSASKN